MRLTEREIDEFQSTSYYIKYLLTKPDVKGFELYDGMLRLEILSKILIERNIHDLDDVVDFFDQDDISDLKEKYSNCLHRDAGTNL